MNLEKIYHTYVQNAKHSPSGKELINIATFFYHFSPQQAAAYIHYALVHGEIRQNPILPDHYII